MQQDYGVRDVEKLLRLSRGTIHALIKAGFVSPTRGVRNSYRFSFRDLIVLRTAQTLVNAKVPQGRIARAMQELRRKAESGQQALDFGGEAPRPSLKVVEQSLRLNEAQEWFENATVLERVDSRAAMEAYGRAIDRDPAHLEARINLGRLLHETGRMHEAEKVYRAAPKASALLLYNLAVLLGDLGRPAEAIRIYEGALGADPALADGHYNLALLYEKLGRKKDAIRHMAQYRRLTG